jgi:hypothetical protein
MATTETYRKFATEEPTPNTICRDCGEVYSWHYGNDQCPSKQEKPTEMTSLTQIKAKLDALNQRMDMGFGAYFDKLTEVAESQGKLLAALNSFAHDFEQQHKIDRWHREEIISLLKSQSQWAMERTEAIQKERAAQHKAVIDECGEIRGMISQVFQETLLVRHFIIPGKPRKPTPRRSGRGKK